MSVVFGLMLIAYVLLWFHRYTAASSLAVLESCGIRCQPPLKGAVYDHIDGLARIGKYAFENRIRVRVYTSGMGISFKAQKDEYFLPMADLEVTGKWGASIRYVGGKMPIELDFSDEAVNLIAAMKEGGPLGGPLGRKGSSLQNQELKSPPTRSADG